jgi:5'-3' exonuclease
MGVPAFFRWLSRKYPSVIIECTENKVSAPKIPPPLTQITVRGSFSRHTATIVKSCMKTQRFPTQTGQSLTTYIWT